MSALTKPQQSIGTNHWFSFFFVQRPLTGEETLDKIVHVINQYLYTSLLKPVELKKKIHWVDYLYTGLKTSILSVLDVRVVCEDGTHWQCTQNPYHRKNIFVTLDI